MQISQQMVRVNTASSDDVGCLVFVDGQLVGVFVQLSLQHDPEIRGKWFLEHGFGPLETIDHPTFDDLGAAENWVALHLRGAVAVQLR